ncbi:MAG: aldo/keto reductase [Candidatus Latescibacterota bacterium]
MSRSAGSRLQATSHLLSRRLFLQSTSALAAGLGVLGTQAWATPPRPAALNKRRLGRTGLQVTDISFGGIQIQQERLLDVVIDRGINLIHTAPGYGGGKSIRIFGQVMKRRRDEVFLALKENPVGGIDGELALLNTDHVDILVPPLHTLEEINDPELPGAFERLKKEGKIRFSGYACHQNQAEIMTRSVELGFFDVMLIGYNLANRGELDPILARARQERNMGFMAMKACKDLTAGGHASAFASLLGNLDVHTLLVGMSTLAEVEANAAASGRKTGWYDRLRLLEYAHVPLTACTLCGACDRCPHGVAVGEVLRCGLYAQRGEVELARTSYQGLAYGQRVAACLGCGRCEQNCPRRRPVRAELQAIHAVLS